MAKKKKEKTVKEIADNFFFDMQEIIDSTPKGMMPKINVGPSYSAGDSKKVKKMAGGGIAIRGTNFKGVF
jgi:hypothetical protein